MGEYMRKEYIPLAIILIILIALNVIFDTFPLEGIIYVGVIVCIFIYVGKLKMNQKELSDRMMKLENQINEKKNGE